MLFEKHTRPNNVVEFIDISVPPAIESCHDALIFLGYEFHVEVVPAHGTVIWTAGIRGDDNKQAIVISQTDPSSLSKAVQELHSQCARLACTF